LAERGILPAADGTVLSIPKLSPETLDAYRKQLTDPVFAEKYPEQHASLKASVDAALAKTGQTL
jgi:hypothetical protein